MQRALAALGYALAADGKPGPKTKAAVQTFQISHGSHVDGIVGPTTEAALRQTAADKSRCCTEGQTAALAIDLLAPEKVQKAAAEARIVVATFRAAPPTNGYAAPAALRAIELPTPSPLRVLIRYVAAGRPVPRLLPVSAAPILRRRAQNKDGRPTLNHLRPQ